MPLHFTKVLRNFCVNHQGAGESGGGGTSTLRLIGWKQLLGGKCGPQPQRRVTSSVEAAKRADEKEKEASGKYCGAHRAGLLVSFSLELMAPQPPRWEAS